MRRSSLPSALKRGLLAWLAVWLLVGVVWGVLSRVDEVAIAPGRVLGLDSLVGVAGHPAPALDVVVPTTVAHRLTPLGWLLANLESSVSVVPEVPELRSGDAGALSPSQQAELAAVVAGVRAAGLHVEEFAGQIVRGVLPSSPLRGRVAVGDLIDAVDGVPVPTEAAYASAVAAAVLRPRVVLSLVRAHNGALSSIRETIAAPSAAGQLGLVTTSGVGVILPLGVELHVPDADVPSSGLGIALVVAAELDPRLVRYLPRVPIAAIAGVDAQGNLTGVSELRERIDAARVAGIRVVVVAASQQVDARSDAGGALQVVAARTVRGAAQALEAVSVGREVLRVH